MTNQDTQGFEERKRDHIRLALLEENQASESYSLDSIHLRHEAIPDLNFNDINIQTTRFGKTVATPFLISSMTAGHKDALILNERLMHASSLRHWAMGVGSQRKELIAPDAAKEWKTLIRAYPNVELFSNIGIAQIINLPMDDIKRLLDNINAKGLIVHCNPLQECIQPEGTPEFKGSWQALEHLKKSLDRPLIVKETGCGFSTSTLSRLNDIGVDAVDVSGLGGTHWGRIEGGRATSAPIRVNTASTFKNWGITTKDSMENALSIKPTYELWGSGGVRHGLDAAKLIALGAQTVGFAKLMLEAAMRSFDDLLQQMDTIEYEFKTAMFCTGNHSLSTLKGSICR